MAAPIAYPRGGRRHVVPPILIGAYVPTKQRRYVCATHGPTTGPKMGAALRPTFRAPRLGNDGGNGLSMLLGRPCSRALRRGRLRLRQQPVQVGAV